VCRDTAHHEWNAVPGCIAVNVTEMMEIVDGFMSAAPTPCTTLSAMSTEALPARPQPSDDSVKMTSPTTNMSRRPMRSASLPPVSMSAPKVRAYPVTTHSSSETFRCSDFWIVGSATFTIVLSSMIMNRPNETAANVHHL